MSGFAASVWTKRHLGWLFVGLSGLHFLLPHELLMKADFDDRSIQHLLVIVVTLYLVIMFLAGAKPVASFLTLLRCIFYGLVAGLAYTGLLELAQIFTPDRQARLSDFELNMAGIVTASVLFTMVAIGAWLILRVYDRLQRRAVEHYGRHR